MHPRAAVRASAAPGDVEALRLAAVVDHRSLLGMLKAVHFRAAAGGAGGWADGDATRFHSRLGREVFMLTCEARFSAQPCKITGTCPEKQC